MMSEMYERECNFETNLPCGDCCRGKGGSAHVIGANKKMLSPLGTELGPGSFLDPPHTLSTRLRKQSYSHALIASSSRSLVHISTPPFLPYQHPTSTHPIICHTHTPCPTSPNANPVRLQASSVSLHMRAARSFTPLLILTKLHFHV